jgi:hypothetical protein
VGRRCSNVLERKLPSIDVQVVCSNVEGHGHGPLDFCESFEESLTYKCGLLKVLKTGFRRRRRLVGGPEI